MLIIDFGGDNFEVNLYNWGIDIFNFDLEKSFHIIPDSVFSENVAYYY